MKKYYCHEAAYQKLVAEGGNCWGHDDFDQVAMAPFLRGALERTGSARRRFGSLTNRFG